MVNALLNNFSGGEVSPRIWPRPEVSKVKFGLRECTNAIPVTHGGAMKRPGKKFVVSLPDPEDRRRFIRFEYRTTDTYQLMFGDEHVWFFREGGLLTHTATAITDITNANPAVVTSAAHGLSNGDPVWITGVSGMTQINNRVFTVANATTNTFELSGVNSTGYAGYVSGGTAAEVVQLTTPYTISELPMIQHAQINDVIYLVHPDHPIRKVVRNSNTSWSLQEPDITTGPFQTVNSDRTLKITPSSFSESATAWGTYVVGTTCTLTASDDLWDAGHVGTIFRLFEEGGESGIGDAPIGTTRSLSNGQVYTKNGNVYGISNVTAASQWQAFTRVPDHEDGTVTVSTVAGASFKSHFLHPGYCIVRITAVTSATVATAEIIRYQIPESVVSGGTSFWEEGAWSGLRGYPSAVTLFEQRLWFAGTAQEPTAIWGSQSGVYEGFKDGAEDDDAITYRLSSGQADAIRWLLGRKVLMAGTSTGEYVLTASSQQEALTPTNVKAVLQTDVGTSLAQPVAINQAVLYPQRNGAPSNPSRKLREFAYVFSQDAFNSVELSLFAEHIFGEGFDEVSYQREPESVIWCRRTDGLLAACTYERPQEVIAWHRHELGGGGVVQAIGVMPGSAGDELWMQVQRTIDGETVSYVEYSVPKFIEGVTAKENAWFVDAGLQYSGSLTQTITGLWHLRGQQVTALMNGVVVDTTVSSSGSISVPDAIYYSGAASLVATIGLPYTMTIETTEIEAGGREGTVQSRKKRISRVFSRVLQSLGGLVSIGGVTTSPEKPIVYRTPSDPMDNSPPLFSGYLGVDTASGWERERTVRYTHSDPLPFFIHGVVAEQEATG